jgi:predicted enzyme related to lactoylglutathione lyase/quinol monooxygenase YgiN
MVAEGGVIINRREFIAGSVAVVAAGASTFAASEGENGMYGLIGRMRAKPGQRDALIGVLTDGASAMPGCLSYIVARDSADADALWITEVWDSKESHDASLSLPRVKEAIAKGRPLIAAMDPATVTTPVGGHGLTAAGSASPGKSGTADPIGYFEFAGPDAGALAHFYERVFGWKPAPGPFPGYVSMAADAGAGLPGGFRQEGKPERVLYIRVADLDASLAKVVAAGGRVLIPPTNVPGVVHFALFEDPQGNRAGIVKS